ncbi:hypothetical protein HDU98_008167 [Podochytrium sp. JEL0797]|nr:hypothetical protein HDU98_008167 [Podochytrium sp. JEL0797]
MYIHELLLQQEQFKRDAEQRNNHPNPPSLNDELDLLLSSQPLLPADDPLLNLDLTLPMFAQDPLLSNLTPTDQPLLVPGALPPLDQRDLDFLNSLKNEPYQMELTLTQQQVNDQTFLAGLEPYQPELTLTPAQLAQMSQDAQLIPTPTVHENQHKEQKLWKKMFGSHSHSRQDSQSPPASASSPISAPSPPKDRAALSLGTTSSVGVGSWFSRGASGSSTNAASTGSIPNKLSPKATVAQDSDSEDSDDSNIKSGGLGNLMNPNRVSKSKYGGTGKFGGTGGLNSGRESAASSKSGGRKSGNTKAGMGSGDVVMSDADDEGIYYGSDTSEQQQQQPVKLGSSKTSSVSSLKAKLSSLALNIAPK